jgi:hypothetical protein
MLLCPLNLVVIWGACCYQLCSGSSIEEMKSMPLAHAAKASTRNLEFFGCHLERKNQSVELKKSAPFDNSTRNHA